jgi:fructosamine-3-kinase
MEKPNEIEINIPPIESLINSIIPKNNTHNIERTSHNFSTIVFKIIGNKIFYLRIAVDKKENFTPETLIHSKLIELGLKVPEIIFFENFSAKLNGHSFMLIPDIGGIQMNNDIFKEVIYEAGKRLAKINSLQFKGFGMIERFSNDISEIKGSKENHIDFILNFYKEKLLKICRNNIITDCDVTRLENFIEQNKHLLDIDRGNLVHGDFNLNHIFQKDGVLSGIIDFGDAKISNQFYDLAYFKICNRNYFEDLFDGYKQNIVLPENWENILKITTLIVGIRIISSEIDNINFVDNKILKEKIKSFKKEVAGL